MPSGGNYLLYYFLTYLITYLLAYLITYLLTPWSRVLLEKLTYSQLVQKFPAFYGTRKFITSLTNARHLSLSWASSIQSIPPHPTSWGSILILFSRLRLMSSGDMWINVHWRNVDWQGWHLITEEILSRCNFSTASSIWIVVERNRILCVDKPATDCLRSCTANTSTLSSRLLACSHNCFGCHISRPCIML